MAKRNGKFDLGLGAVSLENSQWSISYGSSEDSSENNDPAPNSKMRLSTVLKRLESNAYAIENPTTRAQKISTSGANGSCAHCALGGGRDAVCNEVGQLE